VRTVRCVHAAVRDVREEAVGCGARAVPPRNVAHSAPGALQWLPPCPVVIHAGVCKDCNPSKTPASSRPNRRLNRRASVLRSCCRNVPDCGACSPTLISKTLTCM
jgi:hypothetical protein